MNYIDDLFNNLINNIEKQKKEDLFLFMKENYLKVNEETRKSIEDFFKKFPYWGTLNKEKEDYKEIENACNALKEGEKELRSLYNDLSDFRSKATLFAILNNWYCYDFNSLNKVIERTYLHYFDLDIIPKCEKEVFVDLGAYTGDTIEELLYTYKNNFEHIYAYEMSEESVNILKETVKKYPNIEVRKKAISDTLGVGKIKENEESASANILEEGEGVIRSTLDEDIKEKITIIKMDIEGSETKAILGSKEHIKKDKPKMMVSVYHGFQDLIGIWKILKELNPDYKFYLRYYGGPIFPTEIVLYAI